MRQGCVLVWLAGFFRIVAVRVASSAERSSLFVYLFIYLFVF